MARRVDPTSRLLLRAAGLTLGAEALQAWKEYRAATEPGRSLRSDEELLPSIHWNLRRSGYPTDPYLAAAYLQCFGSTVRILDQVAEAVRALNVADVPTLLLKRTAMVATHPARLGVRPLPVVHMLVPTDLVGRALDALEEIGWVGGREWLETSAHKQALLLPPDRSLVIYRNSSEYLRFEQSDRDLFARSVDATVAGVSCRVMEPADQLIHLLLDEAHDEPSPSNLWILDVLELLRCAEIRPDEIRRRAESLGLVVLIRKSLRLAQSVFEEDPGLSSLLSALEAPRVPLWQQAECFVQSGRRRWLRGVPSLWFRYLRSSPRGEVRIRHFPSFLVREKLAINVERGAIRSVLGEARKRLRSRLNSALGRLDEVDPEDWPMEAMDVEFLKSVRGRHKGATAVVLGNGRSLRRFRGYRVRPGVVGIGVNRSTEVIDTEYHVHADLTTRAPSEYRGTRFGPKLLTGEPRGIRVFGTNWWRRHGKCAPGTPTGLSGLYAIEMAVFLGCTRIYLVGFDGNNSGTEGHFYPGKPVSPKIEKAHNIWISHFEAFHHGIALIQTNRKAAIRTRCGGNVSDVLVRP